MRSPLYRWRFGGPPADKLLIIPQDLRTADPSFLDEVRDGQFGLANAMADLDGKSPFIVRPPTLEWERALHGFEWLRDLRASGDQAGREEARKLVIEWIRRFNHRGSGTAWQPAILARRLISWLSYGGMIVSDASRRDYDRFFRSLNQQMRVLAGSCSDMPEGAPRATAFIAVMFSRLCLAEQEDFIDSGSRALCDELDRQILPDGGHVSRNPAVLVELLLDLLPLRQCFIARDRKPPERLSAALRRMMPMIRYMRLGDGRIARFNGMGATLPDRVATVLAYDDSQTGRPLVHAKASNYVRLQRRNTILILDAGPTPPISLSASAHAGWSSFELSSGSHPLIVNCGAPGPAYQDWQMIGRATASHSTLSIGGISAGRLSRSPLLSRCIGGIALNGPDKIAHDVQERNDGSVEVIATHNAYEPRFGVSHHRAVRLAALGDKLIGLDRVSGDIKTDADALDGSVMLTVHFHLHPTVTAHRTNRADVVAFSLPNGEIWQLSATGGSISFEESTFLADMVGPVQSIQAVIRAKLRDGAEIRWHLARARPGEMA